MEEPYLEVHGMSCGHCVASVSNALKGLDGVRVHSVEPGGALFSYDPGKMTPEAIRSAVSDAGYEVVAR